MPNRGPAFAMERVNSIQTGLLATTTVSSANSFNKEIFTAGGFCVTSLTGATTANFYVSPDNINFYELADSTNAVVAQGITLNQGYALPAGVSSFPYVCVTVNAGQAQLTVSKQS